MDSIPNPARTMLALVVGSVLSLSVMAVDKTPWFSQDYSGFDSATWSDTLGKWSNTASNVFVSGESPCIEVGGGITPLTFSPNGSTDTSKAHTAVHVDATFRGASDLDALTPPESQGGLALTWDAATDSALVFVGYVKVGGLGRWIELAADGVTPAENVQYRIGLEVKYDSPPRGNPWAATATRVRYSVDGHVLHDAAGNEWFDSAKGGMKRISTLAFTGIGGKVGAFSAARLIMPSARATIAYDKPVRAKAGASFSFADSVTTNAGAVLSGELSWKWYAGNGRGEYGDVPISTDTAVTPTAAHYARWIKGEAYDASGYAGEGRFWYSKLPVMYITTDDGAMPTAAKEEHDGTLKIQGNDEYKDDYDGAITIKVRGNTTAGLPKKPYKIKLDSKANLFGLGGAKNKHWVLLANYLDESLMRNKLAYDYSALFGLVHLKSTWVDVVFNGKYVGVYQVCPHIRVAEDRIDVFDWEAAGEDAADAIAERDGLKKAEKKALEAVMSSNFLWVTSGEVTCGGKTYAVTDEYRNLDIAGGYLFESSHEYDEASKFTCLNLKKDGSGKTNLLVYVMLNKPEFLCTNPTMMDYCSNYWQRVTDAWCGAKGINAQGEHWSDLCNVPSMAGFWWTITSLKNGDAVRKSRYCYLPHGGKLTFGPVWDFDYGVGGIPVRGQQIGTDPDTGKAIFAEASHEGWIPGLDWDAECWQREWCSDPLFLKAVYKCYADTCDYFHGFAAQDGLIDQYAAYLNESARANEDLWLYKIGWSGDDGDVAALKSFLSKRSAWLDATMVSYESFTNSIGSCRQTTSPYIGDVPATVPTSLDGKVTQAELESWMNEKYPEVTNRYGVAFEADYRKLVDKVDEEGRSPTGKPWPFATDYIAGTDPKNPESAFKIVGFEIKDGVPEVTFDPDLKSARAYTTQGKETLDPQEEWGTPTDDSKFFRVKVELP